MVRLYLTDMKLHNELSAVRDLGSGTQIPRICNPPQSASIALAVGWRISNPHHVSSGMPFGTSRTAEKFRNWFLG